MSRTTRLLALGVALALIAGAAAADAPPKPDPRDATIAQLQAQNARLSALVIVLKRERDDANDAIAQAKAIELMAQYAPGPTGPPTPAPKR